MELRSFSHLHFIQAIKGDLVEKVLNVNHGRPALKFKNIKDIYETGDGDNHDPLPIFRPKFEFEEDLATNCNRVKNETSCVLTGEISDTLESNCNGGGGEEKNGSDDFVFSNMTLKQIKERCKAKKRKFSSKETAGTCSLGKQDHSYVQKKEEEYDFMVPLSSLKSTISKTKKTKRKLRGNSVSSLSQNALCTMKSEEIPSDQVITKYRNLPVPVEIKVEVAEPSNSICKDMVITAMDSSCGYNESISSDVLVSTLFGHEPMFSVPKEEYDEYRECSDSKPILKARGPNGTTMLDKISTEDLETDNDSGVIGVSTWASTLFNNEPRFCIVNEQSNECREPVDPQSDEETRDIAEVIDHRLSDFSLSEPKKVESTIESHSKENCPETISPLEHHIAATYNDFQSSPCIHGTDNNRKVIYRHWSCLSEDEAKEDASHLKANIISSSICNSLWNSSSYSGLDGCLVSRVNDSPTSKEKQSTLSPCTDAEKNCSAVLQSCIDMTVTSSPTEDCHHLDLQHPPERLLSTRKAISPTSRKRLSQAMDSTDLDDEQYYKFARKLCYGKLTENKIDRLEGANPIKRAEVTTSPNQFIQKAKSDKNSSHNKGILKVSRLSRAVPRFSTRCTSIQSCSESAISFSQQQMHDIESIASKLAKELKSMKDIAEEALHSNFYPATSLKYSSEEVRIAIQNATRVEENARRWLSIMARDCNRFCKIMKLTEKGPAASGSVAYKEKRKIIFADEAGKNLCDIKTFKNDISSSVESNFNDTIVD